MLKIIIVEDEVNIAQQLKLFIQRYAMEFGEEIRTITFQNPTEFLRDYENDASLIFMDINMPQMNGMKVAKKLRKSDSKVNLVFITYLAQYAINGYEVNAIDFILKPVNYDMFKLKFERIMRLIDTDSEKKIMVKTAGGLTTIYTAEIRYIEIIEHYLYFHLKDEILKSRGTLKEVQKILEGEPFELCNKCYLVNLDRVESIVDHMVVVDYAELQISRPKKKYFLKKMADYYGNRKVNMGKLQ